MRSPRLRSQATAAAAEEEAPPAEFRVGDEVEVMPSEAGFRGAHFAARIARSNPTYGRYTVVYDALVSASRGGERALRETVAAQHVRPRPPPPEGAVVFSEHDVVDALFNDAWWVGVAVGGGVGEPEEGKVRVCFPETREVMEFGAGEVRPHLEWVAGEWRSSESLETLKTLYDKGTHVEVAQLKENSVIAWFPAAVAEIIWKNCFLVEYTAVKRDDGAGLSKEIVDVQHIRPSPPCASAINFYINDQVEALRGDGWWPGLITEVHPGSVYTFTSVHLDKEIKFDQKVLRLRHDWVDGQWLPVSQNPGQMKFKMGSKVEVSSDDEGFHGAWYEATVLKSLVLKSLGNKILVEYKTLRADDETTPLTETVDVLHIRPSPPETLVPKAFKALEEVDAFCNDGWWVGIVSKVIGDQRYMVYFKSWKEEMEFGHEQLRPHYDWVGGRWMRVSPALEQ